MKLIGKISLWLSIWTFLLGLIVAFILPIFQIFLLSETILVYSVLILEGIAFLIGLVSIKTKTGKIGALLSLLIIAAIVLYFWIQSATVNPI